VSDSPLLVALRTSGHLSADQMTAAERAFAEAGGDAGRLADLLLQAGSVTKYQHRKIQLGRSDDLVFGHFLVLERIGEGGMGKVYRAIHMRLGRTMALKTIRPNLLANKTVISRYKREARAAAALTHPNIVELYEAEDFDGRYYLAMEFVEGVDLSRLMKELIKDKRTVAPSEAAEYIRQGALGLQHAHDKGFVHRDIKPSNLLVSGERALPGTGGKASVKILDMGLVRSLLDDDNTQVDLTRDGTVVGTPDYMSPEQAKNSSTVDHRADVYSLGCTLFYLLKGAPPYSEGTAIDKLIRHQLDPVPDIRQFRPDVPPGLAAVIKRMMAKRPDERFQTATDVAKELGLYTEDAIGFNPITPAAASAFQFVDLAAQETATSNDSMARTTAPAQVPTIGGRTLRPAGTGRTLKPVGGPPAGSQRSATSPLKPKAIAKPVPDATPSDSLPGTDVKKSGRTETPQAGNSRTRRNGRRPTTRKKEDSFPVVPVAVAAAVVTALVVIAAIVLNRAGKTPASTATPDAGGKVAAAAPAAKLSFRPVAELLPDDTAAVLVTQPRAFWEAAQPMHAPASPVRQSATFLNRALRFDPFKFDRVVVAFSPIPVKCLAVGEGGPLANADQFRDDLDKLEWFQLEKEKGGAYLLRRNTALPRTNPDRAVRAALLPAPAAYLIGHTVDLADVVRQAGTRKEPGKVDPKLLAAIADTTPATDQPAPVLTFAATGAFHLPSQPGQLGVRLAKDDVDLLVVRVWQEDPAFRVELAVSGRNGTKVRDFIRVNVPTVLRAYIPGEVGKKLATAVVAATDDAILSDDRGSSKMSVTFRWDCEAVHDALSAVVPAPPSLVKPN
jgi:serine/threonine-protein kinase